jgi:ABC-type protease/lipase transport system fused ATPase/permease subunit
MSLCRSGVIPLKVEALGRTAAALRLLAQADLRRRLGGHVRLAGRLLALSALLAVLQLAASFSMLRLYDKVLTTEAGASLAGLAGLVAGLLLAFVCLDAARSRILCRAGLAFVESLDGRMSCVMHAASEPKGREIIADLERIARFAGSAGPAAFLDAVWLPACLVASVALHPALGLFLAVALVVQAALAVASERAGRGGQDATAVALRRRLARHSGARACADPGGTADTLDWCGMSRAYFRQKIDVAESAMTFAAVSRGLRMALQMSGLGLSALLVSHDMMSPGALVAASFIMARAFSILDITVMYWRAFAAARDSHRRLVSGSVQP